MVIEVLVKTGTAFVPIPIDSVVSDIQGTPGPIGPEGPQGPAGTDGIAGEQGIPGVPGAEGVPGSKGDTGDQGSQGIQGVPGNDGNPGVKGDTGDVGATGPKGDTGDTGLQGEQGIQGIQGIQGNPGVKGDTGDQGIQGIQGTTGPSNYTIAVQALTSSPADATTVYFGMLPKAPTTTAAISKIYIRATGTIKRAEIYCYSGTAGTAEAWSLYIRKNNTTDTLIATVSAAASERVFTNAALSIAVVSGDYIEIKSIQPTWVTNPLTTIYGGYIYIE